MFEDEAKAGVGRPHKTLCAVRVHVRDYDSGSTSKELPTGSIFQPWRPLTENSTDIPITLGRDAVCFDWGVTSSDGHFISVDDFVNHCERVSDEKRSTQPKKET